MSSATTAKPNLPAWHPAWARDLAETYYSGTISMFVLHGNVHDLVRVPKDDGTDVYLSLSDFLATQVFGTWPSMPAGSLTTASPTV